MQECGFPTHLRVDELLELLARVLPDASPRRRATRRRRAARRAPHPHPATVGGQRRRLDFALALAGDPELIFLDEPTTGFDPEARHRCWTAIENLQALGKTIVLTTHYLDEAEHLADQVAILVDGRIRANGTISELAQVANAPTRISFTSTTGEPIVLRTKSTTRTMPRAVRHVRRAPRPGRGAADTRRHLPRTGRAVNRLQLLGRQVLLEQRAFWRNPETAFFTFALPIGLL